MNDISRLEEFKNHEFVSFFYDETSQLRGFIAIHSSKLGPATGATRFQYYKSSQDALQDSLRLSRTMTFKSAMAGLKHGGAKAVIMKKDHNSKLSKQMLKVYANYVNRLGGNFITGTDVGLKNEDVKYMKKYTTHMIGTLVDPVFYTVLGLVEAIKMTSKYVFGTYSLNDKTFAIQGLGKIGAGLARALHKEGARLIVTDIDKDVVKRFRKEIPSIIAVNHKDIHSQAVDIFSPCALNHSINRVTIPKLKCKIVLGGANNQLENDKMGMLLLKKGVLYAPDYVANSGGLISVVDEYETGRADSKKIKNKLKAISKNLKKVFEISEKSGNPTNVVADMMAESLVSKA